MIVQTSEAELPQNAVRVQRRLDRERQARRDSETIAEKALADLYAKQLELEARQHQVHLLQSVSMAANESENLEDALMRALDLVCAYTGWPVGHAYLCEGSDTGLSPSKLWRLPAQIGMHDFRTVTEAAFFLPGEGLPGRVLAMGRPCWIDDLTQDNNFPRAAALPEMKLRAGFAFPILVGLEIAAVLEFFAEQPTAPDEALLDLLPHIGTQLGRVIERERARETVRWQAYHDVLTGLPNRSLFQDRLMQVISMASRHGSQAGVLFLDLDRFKQVNDTLGHAAGDQLLREVASRFGACLREEDTLARMGGDEFTVLLPSLPRAEQCVTVARKLQECLTAPVVIDGQELFVSTSIGLSLFPGDGSDADTLLRNADAAMYRTKKFGGGGYQLYAEEMNQAARERLSLESQMRQALSRRQFVLYYQPQVDLKTGQLLGAEALIRWQHPEMGLVPPTRFIPLAEETGLILPVGEWVLAEAIHQAAQWWRAGRPVRVSVNLSARQFEQENLAVMVADLLAASGLPPAYLELELTESTLMTRGNAVVQTLHALKSLGLRLAVDDFGTGYSSLAYLRNFPLDVLKIDRSFVLGLSIDQVDTAIVRAVIQLAHAIGLEVVAEGVETEDQRQVLLSLGCDVLQGYLFSPPQPISAFEPLLFMPPPWPDHKLLQAA